MYALNAATFGLSEYSGVTPGALVVFGGALYASRASGLVEFSGSDDDGTAIAWKLETGLAEHGSQRDKGFMRAYVLGRTDGDLTLTTLTDRDGERLERAYRVAKRGGDRSLGRTAKLGRGVKGTSWGWRLEGADGADIRLEGFEVVPVMHQRRR